MHLHTYNIVNYIQLHVITHQCKSMLLWSQDLIALQYWDSSSHAHVHLDLYRLTQMHHMYGEWGMGTRPQLDEL